MRDQKWGMIAKNTHPGDSARGGNQLELITFRPIPRTVQMWTGETTEMWTHRQGRLLTLPGYSASLFLRLDGRVKE